MAMAVSHSGEMHGCTRRRRLVFDFVARQKLNFAGQERIVEIAGFGHQRENGIHHRRVDRAEAFAALQSLEHPILRAVQRRLAKRLPRESVRRA